jgi:peptidoglycan-associated lipoprotein
MQRFVTAAALAGSIVLAGCASKPPAALPPQPANVAKAVERSQAPQQPSQGIQNAVVPGSNADFLAQMNGRNVIYFDTDKYNIDEVDAAALRAQAQWLARYPDKHIRIEGNCDERGTREYNLALGERRANAAKNFLASLGIDASRITTISYGKERPVALGSNEEAWAKNRRDVTVVIE